MFSVCMKTIHALWKMHFLSTEQLTLRVYKTQYNSFIDDYFQNDITFTVSVLKFFLKKIVEP